MLLIPQKNDEAIKQRWTGIQDTIYYDQIDSDHPRADGSVAITGYTDGSGQRKVMRAWKQKGPIHNGHVRMYKTCFDNTGVENWNYENPVYILTSENILGDIILINVPDKKWNVLFYRKAVNGNSSEVYYMVYDYGTTNPHWVDTLQPYGEPDSYLVETSSGPVLLSNNEEFNVFTRVDEDGNIDINIQKRLIYEYDCNLKWSYFSIDSERLFLDNWSDQSQIRTYEQSINEIECIDYNPNDISSGAYSILLAPRSLFYGENTEEAIMALGYYNNYIFTNNEVVRIDHSLKYTVFFSDIFNMTPENTIHKLLPLVPKYTEGDDLGFNSVLKLGMEPFQYFRKITGKPLEDKQTAGLSWYCGQEEGKETFGCSIYINDRIDGVYTRRISTSDHLGDLIVLDNVSTDFNDWRGMAKTLNNINAHGGGALLPMYRLNNVEKRDKPCTPLTTLE